MKTVSLDDKYLCDDAPIFISGPQAIVRILLAQKRRDRRRGLNTAGFVSGYRGSPLGTVDSALWRAGALLQAHDVVFQPGVNEELAATAVYGSQQAGLFPAPQRDGVFAAWYGKGPGVDRAGDALKHGNLAGSSRHGGVLVFAGDDHGGKSSTTCHQSEQALAAALIPVLYPANVAEYLTFGAFGYALSRYSGLWAGFKCVTDTADLTGSVMPPSLDHDFRLPDDFVPPPEGLNIQASDSRWDHERRTVELRLPAAQAFARANGFDRIVYPPRRGGIGIISAGKAALDVLEALDALGLDRGRLEHLGISFLKLGLTWPLAPETVRSFASAHRALLVIEEKRAFIETQVKDALYHLPADIRPLVLGKQDETGRALVPSIGELNAARIVEILRIVLGAHGHADEEFANRLSAIDSSAEAARGALTVVSRPPYFCAGCPHNSSTHTPDGTIAMAGIGCHAMAAFMPHRRHAWPVQMGGEGATWVGIAPFSGTGHAFQNIGDGTYYHSGLLAIRQAIAANARMTYKLLYNDAVAMTGGQPVEGQLGVRQIAAELVLEGVKRIAVVTDDVGKYGRNPGLPQDVGLFPRAQLQKVQTDLQAVDGVSVLIYDQVCAAEKRRRRKREKNPRPLTRVFINELVCEGCGDCGKVSNCVAIAPVETEFGRKRRIDQFACNEDHSCLQGFCPSFVTVEGGTLAARHHFNDSIIPELPEPGRAPVGGVFAVTAAGIGGTGVVTIGALLGMAAHLEGKAVSVLDMTGLSQKNGAVFSHVKIGEREDDLKAARIRNGCCDLLLAFDMVAAVGSETQALLASDRSSAVINLDLTATPDFTFLPDRELDAASMADALASRLKQEATHFLDASRIAEEVLGDGMLTNVIALGAALQRGALPLGSDSIEAAIRLNGASIESNLVALRLGRWSVVDREPVRRLLDTGKDTPAATGLDEMIERRVQFLIGYQDSKYAECYRTAIACVRRAEERVAPGEERMTRAAAANLFKLMAYKDEYEVARLYTGGAFRQALSRNFQGPFKLYFHLAPPIFAPKDTVSGVPRKLRLGGWVMRVFAVLARMKRLRGTAFDPFGRTEERRRERRLAEDYRSLLMEVCGDVTSDGYEAAVALLNAASGVRGYGHVKTASIRAFEAREKDRWNAYRSALESGSRGVAPTPANPIRTTEEAAASRSQVT